MLPQLVMFSQESSAVSNAPVALHRTTPLTLLFTLEPFCPPTMTFPSGSRASDLTLDIGIPDCVKDVSSEPSELIRATFDRLTLLKVEKLPPMRIFPSGCKARA